MATAVAVAGGLYLLVDVWESAGSLTAWLVQKLGPSQAEVAEQANEACSKSLQIDCILSGGADAPGETIEELRSCVGTKVLSSDDPTLNWKDIWTTSVYSYSAAGGGPGGGRDDAELRVGGWGDWYFSLIRFELPELKQPIATAVVALFVANIDGASVELALDRLIEPWDFPRGGTLWWDERPGQRTLTPQPLPPPKADRWYLVNISTVAKEWSNDASSNNGIQIRPIDDFGVFVFFASSQASEPNRRPRLIVC